jgi:DNA polymerase III epsilon subunit family exonuclease
MRVAIDLETTGLHAEQDAIVEIGAVKFAGGETLETFETFVAPAIPLPYRIQRLTGIMASQVRDAPPLVSVLPRLHTFLGDLPLVGHNIPFDVAFLRRVGLARRNPLIDTYEVASALMPRLKNYTLASVAEALGIPGEIHHRALADAQLARQVLLALLNRLEALDSSVLEALDALPAPREWTLSYFLRQQMRARQTPTSARGGFGGLLTSSLGEQLRSKLEVDPAVLALAIANENTNEAEGDAPTPTVVPDELSPLPLVADVLACLDEGGVMLVEMPGTDEHVLALAEAAVQWASRTGERIALVAADETGMGRLAHELLPRICARAGDSLAIAALAEREAYLCLHRWFGAARTSPDGPLAREVVHGLAKMLLWVRETHTGLRAEIALPGPETQAWERVRSGEEFGDGWPTCAYRRDGYCFAARAEDRASVAAVVVSTHAALAASLTGHEAVLADVTRVIVLDAGLLEEELRRASSATIERETLLNLLARLASTAPGGQRAGLLHQAAARLGAGITAAPARASFESVPAAVQSTEAFFAALRAVLAEATERSGAHAQDEAGDPRLLRLDAKVRGLAAWKAVQDAWHHLARRLTVVVTRAREIARAAHAAEAGNKPIAADGVAVELLGIAGHLEQTVREGARALDPDEHENELRWLRVPYPAQDEPPGRVAGAPRVQRPTAPRAPANAADAPDTSTLSTAATGGNAPQILLPAPVLHHAIVRVGSLLAPLYVSDRALVLSGSSLQFGGEFDHIRGTLGLPNDTRGLAMIPDRTEQTLLALPADVPEPNAPHYQHVLEETLVSLAGALGGRVVVLFPSHAALRATCAGIRRTLERQDILVLAQGQDGSARQLWHTFGTQPRTILLGAGSFWNGREQGERSPACVLVTRLPFPALSDPLQAARSEQWEDPQTQYVVPQAALKLRQALNGLAWRHSRRNAVVLFDRRIQKRGYGQTILGTLPRCTQRQEPVERLVEAIVEWVG